jgi:hypothetical protein
VGSLAFAGSAVVQVAASASGSGSDGTDPTELTATASTSYEHLYLFAGNRSDTLTLRYSIPLPQLRGTSVQVKMQFIDTDRLNNPGLKAGDLSIKLSHVFERNASYGIVANIEPVFATSNEPDRGYGHGVLKFAGTFAKLLPGGHIFAPTLQYACSLEQPPDGRPRVCVSTLDLYYVHRLPSPYSVTLDPTLSHDRGSGKTFGALSVRLGCKLGKDRGDDLQMILKPQVGIGSERAAVWGAEFEVKLLNF